MIALDEDALICDFAETYGIYDFYKLPVLYAAVLANGLRVNSRIKMAKYGLKVELNTLLLAHVADSSAINCYLKTKNAEKGRNRPKSFVNLLMQEPEEKVMGFDSGDDFDREWERINHE